MSILTTNFDRGKLVLGLGSPRGSWAGVGLGQAWRSVLLWLPCISLPLALAESNAKPSNFGPRSRVPWRRARPRLDIWAHADTGPARAQAEPPRQQRNSRAARAEVGASEPNAAAKTPIKAEITQGTRIWTSAAVAAGQGTRRPRHRQGKQTHTGLSLGHLVSVDTGMLNENRVGVVDQDS